MTQIQIIGSYGELIVHRESGHIISRDHGEEYNDIVWFDPHRLPDDTEADICGTAFVTDKGMYVRECHSHEEDWGHYHWCFQEQLA
jgi:hypothetical protein